MRTATAQAFTTTDIQFFIDCLTGPVQHDAHMRGWRWHLYTRDSERRWHAVQTETARMIAERKLGVSIVTNNIFPPIPDRRFDWCAYRADDEPDDNGNMVQGYGRTEREAINDLVAEIEEAA